MPSQFEELQAYLDAHFPGSDLTRSDEWPIHARVHLRFELGEPFANGTDERLAQVGERATSIIRDCFAPRDRLRVLINDWAGSDVMFGNTTPGYLYELLGKALLDGAEQRAVEQVRELEEPGEPPLRQWIVPAQFEEIRCAELIGGIANYEQGREPSIGQSVFLVAPERDIAFHMYDDRGCIVLTNDASRVLDLYRTYRHWIVDYWRDTIDEFFRDLV
jgi:hypothetical protein